MTRHAGLIGRHIGYSASPAMHDAAFAAVGLDARYVLLDVPADDLANVVADMRDASWIGANVTQPHKVAVCGLVDSAAPEVERLGAANTVVRDGARLTAHNTDLPALRTELARFGRVRHAVVLGAGGASRAAQAALADLGASVEVIDRAHWDGMAEALERADLLVNATPIGTASDDSPVPRTLLRDDLRVLDLVYRPSPTRLVRDARAVGAAARGGAGMLLRQAALSFELWTGGEAPIALMRAALAHELGNELDA